MPQLTITFDPLTGTLLVEESRALPPELREDLARLLGPGLEIACAAPAAILPAPVVPSELIGGRSVRVSGYWHNSLIEGPGRRSTAKLQGCPLHCAHCLTPDSWDPEAGSVVPVGRLAEVLLDPAYPRDGVSILGGEPFAQPEGLQALVRALRERGCAHILAYSGYTYERLRRMAAVRPAIGAVLDESDVLIDGPYVEAMAGSAGPWTGSGNQRVIDLAATRRAGRVLRLGERSSPRRE
jgi:anaerobic ribonucleoside-triphosphate reductase activating protein